MRERQATSAEFAIGLFLTAIALGVAATGRLVLGASLLACGATVVVWAYAQRRAEAARLASLLAGQTRILEMVATGSSLGEVLDALCRLVESQVPGLICSVLLLEGDRLRDGAGPSLAPTYRRAIDGAPIGPSVGSCGTRGIPPAPRGGARHLDRSAVEGVSRHRAAPRTARLLVGAHPHAR